MSAQDRLPCVLHVRIATGVGGGPEKTILNSPARLAARGYRSQIVYLHPPGDPGFEVIRERAREQGAPLEGLPESLPIDPRTLWRLARLCRKEGVTIWHGHDYKSNLYGWLLRPFVGFDLVTTVHGWVRHTRRTPLYYAIDRWLIRRYRKVIAVSADLEETCRELGVRAERLHLIENAIDLEYFRAAAPRTQGRERLRIGAVGRLSEEKGFELLIEATERLLDEGLGLELTIAGEGELEETLRVRCAESRHAQHISLLGFQEDTRALFGGFDLFCLSSLREGLPNVVLEAMAMEVPVLATRSGGMEAFARDGVDALLCDPGSVEELATGLRRLATNAELRAQLAREARARLEREFSFETRMDRVVAVYAEFRR